MRSAGAPGWLGYATTVPDRVRIARLLLDQVDVTVDKTSEQVAVRFHWIGGVRQDQTLHRPVKCYAQMADYPKLAAKLRALHSERLNATQIAECLNAAGFR